MENLDKDFEKYLSAKLDFLSAFLSSPVKSYFVAWIKTTRETILKSLLFPRHTPERREQLIGQLQMLEIFELLLAQLAAVFVAPKEAGQKQDDPVSLKPKELTETITLNDKFGEGDL